MLTVVDLPYSPSLTYFTVIMTVAGDEDELAVATTGWSPLVAEAGMVMLNWKTPAKVKLEKTTCALVPPTVIVGVVDSGNGLVMTTPSRAAGLVVPNPVP